MTDQNKLSPSIAALVERRAALKAESKQLDDEANRVADAIKARGGEDKSEIFQLENRSTKIMQQHWELLYEMLAIPAATVTDVTVQIEALITDSAYVNEDGYLSSFDMSIGGLEFLQRLPSEIARLAGGLS